MKLLLVEDDTDLAIWLRHRPEQHGFFTEWAEDGHVAELRLRDEVFDAILLDLGLPSVSGSKLLDRLRAKGNATPILVMTARDSLSQRVALLHGGADDFMGKPFTLKELVARIHALNRRSRGRASGVHSYGNLTFDQEIEMEDATAPRTCMSPRHCCSRRSAT